MPYCYRIIRPEFKSLAPTYKSTERDEDRGITDGGQPNSRFSEKHCLKEIRQRGIPQDMNTYIPHSHIQKRKKKTSALIKLPFAFHYPYPCTHEAVLFLQIKKCFEK